MVSNVSKSKIKFNGSTIICKSYSIELSSYLFSYLRAAVSSVILLFENLNIRYVSLLKKWNIRRTKGQSHVSCAIYKSTIV